MNRKHAFTRGLISGIPICLGYISVSFAFGIYSVGCGLTVLEVLLISMTCVTSAGQQAAVPIITGGGGLMELAVSQLVINMRYSLMSVFCLRMEDYTGYTTPTSSITAVCLWMTGEISMYLPLILLISSSKL